MEVLPAIDVLGEEAVRLRRGDYGSVTGRHGTPVELAARFARAGARTIHLVDLDGARSGRIRPAVVAAVAAAAAPAAVQASGGIRSAADAGALVAAGAARVVVGTAAFAGPRALPELVDRLGDRLVVALDVRNGRLRTAGWTAAAGVAVDGAVERCAAAGVARVLCTAIERDGTLEGPDLALVRLVAAGGLPVLAAGGIRSEDDLAALELAGASGAIVGRALLEGELPLSLLRAA